MTNLGFFRDLNYAPLRFWGITRVRVTNLAATLEELKKEGFWIMGADPRGDKSLYEMKFDMNVGLVIGSEGKGIRPLVRKKCDYRLTISMRGKLHP